MLAQRRGCPQHSAAIAEELLAFAREDEAPAHAVEELESQLGFELADLARERRLRRAQANGGFGDSALLGDGDEGSELPEVHAAVYADRA